jgi:hypothetical protein
MRLCKATAANSGVPAKSIRMQFLTLFFVAQGFEQLAFDAVSL